MKSRVIRISILAILLICTYQLQALSLVEENPWSVGINFSSNYSYRTLSINSKDPLMEAWINSINNYEVASVGFNTGLHVRYKLRNSFSTESGISYANYSYQTRQELILLKYNPYGSDARVRYLYHFTYLEVPLRIVFTGSAPKNSFTFSCGIINQFGIEQYFYERVENDDKILDNQKFDLNKTNSYNISATLSAGYLFRKSKKLSYHIEPTYRHQLLNYNEGSDLKKYLFNYGLQIGAFYRL